MCSSGKSFGGCLVEDRLLLITVENGAGIEIYARLVPSEAYRLNVFAVKAGEIDGTPVWESWLCMKEQSTAARMIGGKEFLGPLARLPAIPSDGLFVVLECQVEFNRSDTDFFSNGRGYTVRLGG